MGIGITQRRQSEHFLNEIEDTSEVVVHVRDVCRFGIRRDDGEGNAEAIHISRSPTFAIINDLWRRYMIVPATPIIPGNNYGGNGPEPALADRIDNRGNPGGTARSIGDTRMI